MSKKILLDKSPTGVTHYVDISDDEMITVEHTPTSVEKRILDSNSALRSADQFGAHLQHAARIPINTYVQWKKEWKEKYSDEWTWSTFECMKLNSRDNSLLRTGKKRGGSKLL